MVFSSYDAFFVDENLEPLAAASLEIIDIREGQISVQGAMSCDLPGKLVYVWNAPPEVPYCQRPGVRCNPPRPPPAVGARILTLSADRGGTVITVGVGSADGVTQQSRIALDGYRCAIAKVSDRATMCWVMLTPDKVKGKATVTF